MGEQMITCNIVGSKLVTKLPTNRINGYNLDKHLLKARVCYTVVLPLWCLFCSRRNGATADIFSGGVNLSSACRIGHLDRPCLPKGIIARLFSTGLSRRRRQRKAPHLYANSVKSAARARRNRNGWFRCVRGSLRILNAFVIDPATVWRHSQRHASLFITHCYVWRHFRWQLM